MLMKEGISTANSTRQHQISFAREQILPRQLHSVKRRGTSSVKGKVYASLNPMLVPQKRPDILQSSSYLVTPHLLQVAMGANGKSLPCNSSVILFSNALR